MKKVFLSLAASSGLLFTACSSAPEHSLGQIQSQFQPMAMDEDVSTSLLNATAGQSVSVNQQSFDVLRRYHSANGDFCVLLSHQGTTLLCTHNAKTWFEVRNVLGAKQ